MGLRSWVAKKLGREKKKLDSKDVWNNYIEERFGKYVCVSPEMVFCGDNIQIGAYTYFQSGVIENTCVGKFCSFAPNVRIGPGSHPLNWLSTSPFQYNSDTVFDLEKKIDICSYEPENKQTVIGNDVWVGFDAIIMAGVVIGDGAVIGAGSIVTKNVPPYAIVAGNPAKVIKYRFDEKIIKKILELQWWNVEFEKLNGIVFDDIDKAIEQIRCLKENI